MIYLSRRELLLIHSIIIDETGGPHGVRDYHVIAVLGDLPRQKFGGQELYKTIFIKAALYARNIIAGHPFVDGNKRTGMTAASVFLESNGYQIIAKKGEIEKFALKIVREKLDLEEIAKWLKKHSKKLK
ncbi:MAG: type II toxin-antitoxin system death-on-curing family toxin [Parcubacteria group bacterium]|nr:type II toxin-antitoxin system death-on-curing family toxin [Parcubacteria group bacterium]